jgi:hypothetical protein
LLKLTQDLRQRTRWAPVALMGLLAVAVGLSLSQNGGYYYHYGRYLAGQESLAASLSLGWPGFGERLARSLEVADYVRAHTQPDDHIYDWSEDVQLYYFAGRRSAVDIIWPIYIGATGPPARVFGPQTAVILVDTFREPAPPDWFARELAANYRLEAVVAGQEIYRREK